MPRVKCAYTPAIPATPALALLDPDFDAAPYAAAFVPRGPRASDAVPLRHPYFQTARDDQAAARRAEIADLIARDDAFRRRLSSARVLESIQ